MYSQGQRAVTISPCILVLFVPTNHLIGRAWELSTSDSSCKVRGWPGLPSRERGRSGPRGAAGVSRERLLLRARVARAREEPAGGARARSPPPAPERLAAGSAPHRWVKRRAGRRPFGSRTAAAGQDKEAWAGLWASWCHPCHHGRESEQLPTIAQIHPLEAMFLPRL
ncbi:Hypothetical predicted protein [Lynx pardinus]|uniref:Uncharacterized protein n=1 Tax=Lynx pardinus TaxID=191816 RepID=A0A485P5V1_LYNPA|nr:Hypothetical predicted protein [Lynx pardinus]